MRTPVSVLTPRSCETIRSCPSYESFKVSFTFLLKIKVWNINQTFSKIKVKLFKTLIHLTTITVDREGLRRGFHAKDNGQVCWRSHPQGYGRAWNERANAARDACNWASSWGGDGDANDAGHDDVINKPTRKRSKCNVALSRSRCIIFVLFRISNLFFVSSVNIDCGGPCEKKRTKLNLTILSRNLSTCENER